MGLFTLFALQLPVVSIELTKIQGSEHRIFHKSHRNVCNGAKGSEVSFRSDSRAKRLAYGEIVYVGHHIIIRADRRAARRTKPHRKIARSRAMVTDRDSFRVTGSDVRVVWPGIRPVERPPAPAEPRTYDFCEALRLPLRY